VVARWPYLLTVIKSKNGGAFFILTYNNNNNTVNNKYKHIPYTRIGSRYIKKNNFEHMTKAHQSLKWLEIWVGMVCTVTLSPFFMDPSSILAMMISAILKQTEKYWSLTSFDVTNSTYTAKTLNYSNYTWLQHKYSGYSSRYTAKTPNYSKDTKLQQIHLTTAQIQWIQ
jgi:hypothetical protein